MTNKKKSNEDDLRMPADDFDRIMRQALEVKPPEDPPAKPKQKRPPKQNLPA